MPLRFAHAGDFHLDEDRYFTDTAQCLEWFVADAIRASVDLFVINGDLTTYKATIRERNFWVDRLVEMANHAPVILVAGNHGADLREICMSLLGLRGSTRYTFAPSQSLLSWVRLLFRPPIRPKIPRVCFLLSVAPAGATESRRSNHRRRNPAGRIELVLQSQPLGEFLLFQVDFESGSAHTGFHRTDALVGRRTHDRITVDGFGILEILVPLTANGRASVHY